MPVYAYIRSTLSCVISCITRWQTSSEASDVSFTMKPHEGLLPPGRAETLRNRNTSSGTQSVSDCCCKWWLSCRAWFCDMWCCGYMVQTSVMEKPETLASACFCSQLKDTLLRWILKWTNANVGWQVKEKTYFPKSNIIWYLQIRPKT